MWCKKDLYITCVNICGMVAWLLRTLGLMHRIIGHVRFINILTSLRAFRVKIVKFLSIPQNVLGTKKTAPNVEVCPESLGTMLEYWYIKHGLFIARAVDWTNDLFDCRFSKSFQMVFNMKSTFTCTWPFFQTHFSSTIMTTALWRRCQRPCSAIIICLVTRSYTRVTILILYISWDEGK